MSSTSPAQTLVFNSTPNAGEGGIWQSGRGLMADPSGNIWFSTGNTYPSILQSSASQDAQLNDLPMRLIQLSPSGSVLGTYPPANYYNLNLNDLDFSSSGPLLIPGTNSLVAGGKDGVLYLFDTGNPSAPKQQFTATGTGSCNYTENGCWQIHDLAFWNSNLYVWASNDNLRSYSFANGQFNTTPSSVSAAQAGFYAAGLGVSAAGNTPGTGILWALTDGAPNGRSMLRAFDASNVANELWNSEQNGPRDFLPAFAKFTEPTVVNGRVYVPATFGSIVTVYGLLSDFAISTSAAQLSVYRGSSAGLTASVNVFTGFNGAVNLGISGLPAGATATYSPASINGSGSSSLTITTSSSTPTGQSIVMITASSGSLTRSTTLTLNVTTPDTTPPAWSCCTSTVSNGMRTLYFTGWDTGSGLASIKVLAQANSTINIPNFTAGTNNPVTFSETQNGWSSYVRFQLADVAGNTTTIDPCMLEPSRNTGNPAAFACEDKSVTRTERFVTIINGSPGLTNLRIDVNGQQFQVAGLKDNETRVIDIASALRDSGNTTDVVPLGKPGGFGWVIVGDSPITPVPN